MSDSSLGDRVRLADLWPPARRAYRQRVWGAVGLTALALAVATFVVITFPMAVEREVGAYPVMLVVLPPIAAWLGLVVMPGEARLLRCPGRRYEFVPLVQQVRKRPWLPWPRSTETKAWLLTSTDDGQLVAIPVSVDQALGVGTGIAALVRGTLAVGRHVVLDFPNLVMFPTGKVQQAEALPPAAPR